jgi:hypothetical protein
MRSQAHASATCHQDPGVLSLISCGNTMGWAPKSTLQY